jgi:integrase
VNRTDRTRVHDVDRRDVVPLDVALTCSAAGGSGLVVIRFACTRPVRLIGQSTTIAKATGEPRVVMEILGHSSLDVTMNIYGHVMLDAQRDALRGMDGLFR